MKHGFPKVGSRERVFLKKRGVLGAEILAKNKAENVLKFKMGGGVERERCIDGKLIG